MTITINDRRRPAAVGPVRQGERDMRDADEVLVQPLQPYMEGAEHKNAKSASYPAPRHHATELVGHGFAKIVEPKPAPLMPADPVELPPEEVEEPEVEQPDDTSRAPDADQTTASTVPASPGVEPVRPASGPVPPAATSEPPRPARRGRPPGRRA